MSWININEQRVPVNDERYHNRFSLSLEYKPTYGHALCVDKEDVIARYNRPDDTFYEEKTGKPINYSDIQSWYCSFDDGEIGMKIILQAEFKVKGLMNQIVVCYYMFGYYLVDVWFQTEETYDNAPSRINYIRTKYFPVAEKEYYKKLSDVNKRIEERENVC